MNRFLHYALLVLGITGFSIANGQEQNNSLALLNPKEHAVKESLSPKKLFVSDEGAFEVEFPFEMTKVNRDIPSEEGNTVATMYVYENNSRKESYLIGYYLFPAGTYFPEDSSYLYASADNMAATANSAPYDIQKISLGGYPGLSFKVDNKEQEMVYKVRVYLRGSRGYVLLAISTKDRINEPGKDLFLNSFRFRDFKKTIWKPYTSSENHFKINFPDEAVVAHDSSSYFYSHSHTATTTSQDKNTGLSYNVSVEFLSPYFYTKEDEFYKTRPNDYVGEGDSLLWSKDRVINGIKAKEVLVQLGLSHSYKKILFVPYKNSLYEIFAIVPKECLTTKETENFFSSFQFTEAKPTVSIFQSKAKVLLKDLSSPDSLTNASASSALYTYEFEKADLPLIYEALKKDYSDDTMEYRNTKIQLLDNIARIKDPASLSFLKEYYPKAAAYPAVQFRTLQALLELQTAESLKLFLQYIKSDLPKISTVPYGFFSPLKDSLEYNQKVFPEIFYLYKNKLFRSEIYSLGTTLLDSNKIEKSFFSSYLPEMIKLLQSDSKEAKDYNDEYFNTQSGLIILGNFTGNAELSSELASLVNHPDDEIAFTALLQIALRKETMPAKALTRFASKNEYRLRLYSLLKESNNTQLFPAKYLTQEAFAEADMFTYLNGDEFYAEDIALIGNKVVPYNGVNSRFYLFKFKTEDEWYTGISGPHPENKKEVVVNCEATTTNFEPLKSKSTAEHFDSLIGE